MLRSLGIGRRGLTGAASTVAGPAGKSAYEVATAAGFSGTVAQWLASLVGLKGDTGPSGATLLGTVTITETAAIAIAAGVRKVNVAIPSAMGVVVGGNYLLFPVGATPAGYAIADVVATAGNVLQVTMTVPLITLGASYSIPCRLVRINT